MKIPIFILCVFFLNFGNASELDQAFNDLENKNYSSAYPVIKKYAEQGDSRAQGGLARIYGRGFGVNVDYELALYWARKGSEQGDGASDNVLGVIHRNGLGVPINKQLSVEYFEKAALKGNALGQQNLATAFMFGVGVEIDYERAYKWYLLSAENGLVSSYSNIGYLFQFGRGVPQSHKTAFEYYEKSANVGDIFSYAKLGYFYEEGLGVERNYEKSLYWFEKILAEDPSGNWSPIAKFKVAAAILKKSKKEADDFKQALSYLSESAKSDYTPAKIELLNLDGGLGNLQLPVSTKISEISNLALALRSKHSYDSEFSDSAFGGILVQYKGLVDYQGKTEIYDRSKFRYRLTKNYQANVNSLRLAISSYKDKNSKTITKFKADYLQSMLYELDVIHLSLGTYGINSKKTNAIKDGLYKHGTYLKSIYEPGHVLYSKGVDHQWDYYKHSKKKALNKDEFLNLLDFQKSDLYVASKAAFDGSDMGAICNMYYENALDIVNASSLTVDYAKDSGDNSSKVIYASGGEYLISVMGVTGECRTEKMINSFLSYMRYVSTFTENLVLKEYLWNKSYKKLDASEVRVNPGIYRSYYEYALIESQKSNYDYALDIATKLVEGIYATRSSLTDDWTEAYEWSRNPKEILVPFLLNKKEYASAKPIILGNIKMSLGNVHKYHDEIINSSLSRQYKDLSVILEAEDKIEMATFILKKAYEYDYIQSSKIDLPKNKAIYSSLTKILIKQKRFEELEFLSNIERVSEVSSYVRDASLRAESLKSNIFYTHKEVFFNIIYEKQLKNLKSSFKKNSNKKFTIDDQLDLSIESKLFKFIDLICEDLNSVMPPDLRLHPGALANTGDAALFKKYGKDSLVLRYFSHGNSLHILVTSSKGSFLKTVEVSDDLLKTNIFKYRAAVRDAKSDPRHASKKLYDLIFSPVASDVESMNIRHIIVSTDGWLRYVSFPSLYDGNKYLASQFTFSSNSHVDEKDFYEKNEKWNVSGLGVTKSVNNLTALPAVSRELKAIIKNNSGGIYPGEISLDEKFTYRKFSDSVSGKYSVVHVATHFQFSPGTDVNSFLQLGDGTKLDLSRFKDIKLKSIDLITFSACQTAMGGEANGREIASLPYLALRNGARSVLSTLWSINDAGTSVFMESFYRARYFQGVTKAQAIQTAQNDLINSKEYSHPFYWAPFILSGNWK